MEQQCPHWLSKAGCRDPSQCQKGRHDPVWKGIKDRKPGKGNDPASPIAGQPGKGGNGGNGKGKGAEKGGKGDNKKQKVDTPGAKAPAQPKGPLGKKLADDAVTDNKGRPLCYQFMNGNCWNPCPKDRYHGTPRQLCSRKRSEMSKGLLAGGQLVKRQPSLTLSRVPKGSRRTRKRRRRLSRVAKTRRCLNRRSALLLWGGSL